MSVPGVSSVGSVVSRTVNKISSKIPGVPEKMKAHLSKVQIGFAALIGLIVLIMVASYTGKHGKTDEGKKKIGKKVNNWVDLIVIYGVAIVAVLVLLVQSYFAVNVLVLKKDFNTVSSQIENLASTSSSSEELLSALTLNI